jgi:acetoin utilization deacetylase AcuC-like enzyme
LICLAALLKIFYTDCFPLPLPSGHRFPVKKSALLRAKVEADEIGNKHGLRVPEPASDREILRAHDAEYFKAVKNGELTGAEMRRVGLPWSPQMVERARRSAGATLSAARAALEDGVAASLAGGSHHAYRAHGEGYCVINDSAIAALALKAEGEVKRVAIVDCDVHQGNGTAAILAGDSDLFTFSIHAANNYPFPKERSDLDIALADRAEDAEYLEALGEGLTATLGRARPDLVIYLAGADPYHDDQLGKLALSFDGLAGRDRLVMEYCLSRGVPVAVTMAGGYARRIADTVAIHFETVRTAAACASRWG